MVIEYCFQPFVFFFKVLKPGILLLALTAAGSLHHLVYRAVAV